MSKLRILVATVLALSLALVPALVWAQNPNPHAFYGKARIDGAVAPANTKVSALIAGKEVASANADATGDYAFTVQEVTAGEFTDKDITFKVGTFDASQTVKFVAFGSTKLDLGGQSGPAGAAAIVLSPSIGSGNVVVLSGTKFSSGAPVTVSLSTLTVALGPGRDTPKQTGTAVLKANGATTDVTITLTPAQTPAQPVHIHSGSCDNDAVNLGAVVIPLNSVIQGQSTTNIARTLSSLLTGGFAINAHASSGRVDLYTSCGNIPGGNVATPGTVTASGTVLNTIAVLPSSAAGTYGIVVSDNAGRSATATYTIAGGSGSVVTSGTAGPPGPAGAVGPAGAAGPAGATGAAGPAGAPGKDASSSLAMIALIIAIVAAVIALASAFILRKPASK